MAKETFPTRYDAKKTRKQECGRVFPEGDSLAKQSFKDECDINRLMARYRNHGVLPPTVGIGRYGDFSEVGDYHAAQMVLERATQQFASLPADVRDFFKNDPGQMLAFVQNPANQDKAQELGLLNAEPKKPAAPAGEAGGAK